MATQSHYQSEEEIEISRKMQQTASTVGRYCDGVEFEWSGHTLLARVDVENFGHSRVLQVQDRMLRHDNVVMKKVGNAPSGRMYMEFKTDA
jgi:hypothetical protein